MNERDMIVGGRIEARLDQLIERMARIEGGFEQMDKRISGVEQRMVGLEHGQQDLRKDVRQILFVILGTWITIMVAILLKG